VALFHKEVADLQRAVVARPPMDVGSPFGKALGQLTELGAPPGLLSRCRAVAGMRSALALASVAAERELDVVELDRAYPRIGETVGLAWLYATIPTTSADPHWVQLAKSALRDELASLTVGLAAEVVTAGGMATWTTEHHNALTRARSAYAGLAVGSGAGSDVDVAMLTVGVQVLRDLCYAVGA
jgi:glutamate dehydrogenase